MTRFIPSDAKKDLKPGGASATHNRHVLTNRARRRGHLKKGESSAPFSTDELLKMSRG